MAPDGKIDVKGVVLRVFERFEAVDDELFTSVESRTVFGEKEKSVTAEPCR